MVKSVLNFAFLVVFMVSITGCACSNPFTKEGTMKCIAWGFNAIGMGGEQPQKTEVEAVKSKNFSEEKKDPMTKEGAMSFIAQGLKTIGFDGDKESPTDGSTEAKSEGKKEEEKKNKSAPKKQVKKKTPVKKKGAATKE